MPSQPEKRTEWNKISQVMFEKLEKWQEAHSGFCQELDTKNEKGFKRAKVHSTSSNAYAASNFF